MGYLGTQHEDDLGTILQDWINARGHTATGQASNINKTP
jgi:hypothetical protein